MDNNFMIRSMTGFARVERQYPFGRLSWELRSVNHRYLELGFRVPEEFRVLEPDIRRILGEFLSRGKVDATLKLSPATGAASARVGHTIRACVPKSRGWGLLSRGRPKAAVLPLPVFA